VDGTPATLRINLHGYPGKVRVYLPPIASPSVLKRSSRGFRIERDFDQYRVWSEWQVRQIGRNQRGRQPWNRDFAKQRLANIERILAAEAMLTVDNTEVAELRNIDCCREGYVEMYLLLERPPKAKVGQTFPLEIVQLDAERKEVIGGLSARVAITEEPKELRHELRVTTSPNGLKPELLLRAQLVDGNGDRIDPARVSISVTGRGVSIPELKDHKHWGRHAVLEVKAGTKLTVRARLDGNEVASVSHRV
jgi:hypothetical protein